VKNSGALVSSSAMWELGWQKIDPRAAWQQARARLLAAVPVTDRKGHQVRLLEELAQPVLQPNVQTSAP